MRNKLYIMVLLLSSITVSAQTRNISAEILGASQLAGVSYDSRFSGNDGFGYRAGIAYGLGINSLIFSGEQNVHAVTVPIEINYLLGKKRSHLELGLGMSNGLYRVHTKTGEFTATGEDGSTYTVPATDETNYNWGYFFFGDIGYRFQLEKGFTFRIGVNPSFSFNTKHAVQKNWLTPYISIGWSF